MIMKFSFFDNGPGHTWASVKYSRDVPVVFDHAIGSQG